MKKVVYLWCDNDVPFYVGKGDSTRPYSWKSRNRRIKYKRKKCEEMGTFNIFIVSTGLTNEYACYLEKSIIKNNPQLFNYTFGGDGGDTFTKLTEEEKQRKRKLLSNSSLKRKDELIEIGKKFGKYVVDNKLGVHSYSSAQLSEWGSIGGKIGGKISGKNNYDLNKGIHSQTIEQKSEFGKIGGRKTSSQKWMCLKTGFICNAGGLTGYQRKRNIDTSQRKLLDDCPKE
jgi:hypothetical protein